MSTRRLHACFTSELVLYIDLFPSTTAEGLRTFTSPFSNNIFGEAIDIIRERLEEDDSLEDRTPLSPHRVAELLQLCLRSTYFSFNGEIYEQREGAAMGSPVSAVVANLYMEFFEEL